MSMNEKEQQDIKNLTETVNYLDRKKAMEIPATSDGDILEDSTNQKIEQQVIATPIKDGVNQEELFRIIDQGIRPEWMPYQSFKELRSRIQKERKVRLNGTLIHASTFQDEKTKEKIGLTYKKDKKED